MKNNTNIDLAALRAEHSKAPQFSTGNTHEAMLSKTYYTPRKFTVGVNYWTKEEIAKGERTNTDNSRSVIIAPLYI